MQAQSIIHTHGGEIVMLSNVPIKQEYMMEHNHVHVRSISVFVFGFKLPLACTFYCLFQRSRKLVKSRGNEIVRLVSLPLLIENV